MFTMFQITRHIWLGRFASRLLLDNLQEARITHIVNVGESTPQLQLSDGPFRRIEWTPIEDLVPMQIPLAISSLTILHECICDADSNDYVHCVAGQNRSPTILWLYLTACGLELTAAKRLIESHSYDAIPGHPKLTTTALVAAVISHGSATFLPYPRPLAFQPIPS